MGDAGVTHRNHRRAARGAAGGTAGRRGRVLLGLVALAMAVLPYLAPVPPVAQASPASDGNPDLGASCGIDVTLVLDDSGSIDSSEAQLVREGAQAFATALQGTPSRLKTVVFANRAEGVDASGNLTPVLNDVVFRDPADYVAPTSGAGYGGTNWDDGLEVVRRSNGGPGDLVVFLTDGDPTYRNAVTPDGHSDAGNQPIAGTGNTTSPADVSQAVVESDAIKATGAHMFGIGIGFTSAASEQRLNDVTGDEEMTITGGVPTPPFGEADYIVTQDFDELEAVVEAFVRELCGHTLNVTKFLQRADGTTEKATAVEPWEFTATVSPTPDSWQNPALPPGTSTASLTTNGNGGVSFVLDQGSIDHDHLADVVETPQDGWVYNGAVCSVNDFSGAPPTLLFDTVGPNSPGSVGDPADLTDLPVESNKAVNCYVYNREVRTSTISVAKATSPAGLPGDFDFTLTEGATTVGTVNDLSDGESGSFGSVEPGTYAITETPVAGFDLTSAVCDDLATAAVGESEPAGALVVGEAQDWRCTFTNTAQPGSITVVKQALGADGTFPFTSNVPGLDDFDLTTVNGTATSATVVVPVGDHYQVSETTPARWTLTSASCTGGHVPSDIHVGPGEDVVCTFTNTAPAPTIRVVKVADPTSVLEPGGTVTYTVSVRNTSVEPVTVTAITDSIEGGPALDLTTTGGPILSTDCDQLLGDTLAPNGIGTCTFTASVTGNGGDTVVDEVTVTAVDDDQEQATDSDDASVTIVAVPPSIEVSKTPSVAFLVEPGGPVTYTVGVRNTSTETITIDSLTDVIEGGAPTDITQVAPPLTATTCDALLGSDLAPGASTSCTFTVVHVGHSADVPDGFIDDTVTVVGSDDDGSVTDSADAKVAVLDAPPAVTVTKTASPTSLAETAPGQTRTVVYTVTITNDAPEDATVVSITDSVEGGPATDVAGTCDDLIGDVLAPGQTVTCTFTGQVAGDAGDVVHDTVVATLADNEGSTATDDDTAEVTFTDRPASIQVIKTADRLFVPEVSGLVLYRVRIVNTSPTDALTIGSITDAVDGGPPFAVAGSCDDLIGTTLAPAAEVECIFGATVTGNAGDVITDVVSVVATDDDGGTVRDDDDAAVTITDRPSSLTVEKVADVESLPEPGGTVTYTVQITNTSAVDAIALDAITDSVNGAPGVPVAGTCDDLLGSVLPPSSTVTCKFTALVGEHTGDVTNDTVTVDGTDDDGAPVTASASESVTITDVGAALAVTKHAGVSSVQEPGGPVTYTVTIRNASQVDTITLDSITDSVDGGPAAAVDGTCDDLLGTTLDPGDEVTCEFTTSVVGNAGDTIADTVVVDGTDDDGNPVTAQDSETVDVTDVPPGVTVTKTASPSTVAETGPGETRTITYTVTIQNDSPETVTIDSITDSVDGGPATAVDGTCDDLLGTTLAPQASTTCEFTVDVVGDAGDVITDVVVVTVHDDERNPATDDDDATVTFTDVDASLLVTKTADPASVPEPGGPVTYTVSITNTSPADSVTIDGITDSVDGGPATPVDGTCDDLLGTVLAPGASTTCTFTVDVLGDAGDVVADTVVVTGTDDDGEPVTDDGSESVDITDLAPSITVTKVADPASVPEPGGPVTYTVTITNTSPADSVTIDGITDSVDGGPATPVDGTCDDLLGTVLAPATAATCTFTVDVVGQAGDTVSDTVVVTGTDDDDTPVEGQDTEVVDITDVGSSLVVVKAADPTSVPEPGGPVTYTVTITNTSAVDSVTLDGITDSIDGGPATPVDGTCDELVGDVLAPGASVTCTFTGTVIGNAGDAVSDTVVVTGTDDDGEPVEGTDSEVVDVTDVPPTGTITKDADPASLPETGGTVTFTVNITNTSPAEAVTVTSITDEVGGAVLDVTVVNGPITATTCTTGTVLDPGESYGCTFDYLVPAGDPEDVVTDTISATLVDDEQNETTPTDTEEVPLTDIAPTITVVKGNTPTTVAAPGADVLFDVTVTNTSNEEVTVTSLTDSVDGGTPFDITTVADPVTSTTCSLGVAIAPGASYACTFSLPVRSDEATVVPDEVVATVVDGDGTPASAADTAVTTVTAVADLGVEKRLVSSGLVVGQTGTYELVVTNSGPSTAANPVVVDTVPAGLVPLNASGDGWACAIDGQVITCTRGELAAGATSTISVEVGVPAASAGTTVTNVVDVDSDTDDPDLDNNHDEVTNDIPGGLAPTSTATTAAPPVVTGELARTGSSSGGLVAVSLVLLAVGGALVALSRRRTAATR